MNHKLTKRIVAVILFLSAVCLPIVSADGLTDATVKSYEERLAEIAQQKEAALNNLYSIRQQESNAMNEIAAFDEVIKYNTEMKNLAEGQLDSITIQLEKIKLDIADAEASIEKQERALLDRMVHTYMDEGTDYIELILGSKSLVDFLTRIDRVNAILKYDQKIIKELEDNKALLETSREKQLEAEETQLLRIAELEATIKDNMALTDAKYAYLQSLQNNEASWSQYYTELAAAEAQIDKELQEYLAELQRKNQSQYVGGAIGWPIDRNAWYTVTSEFGWRKLFGADDFHYGIDLACVNGTNIHAANSGKVLKVDIHWSYGISVLIDHGGGISTLYAHMSERLVNVGDTVTPGQLIGYVGLTGQTTGYHLHFEVRENGQVVNPRNYLVFP